MKTIALGAPVAITHMFRFNNRPTGANGPFGVIFANNLPKQETRWVTRRKMEVVLAVSAGIIDRAKVLERYAMTEQELERWEQLLGPRLQESTNLKVTQISTVGEFAGSAQKILMSAAPEHSRETFGALTIDYAEQCVYIDGKRFPMPPQLYAMLELTVLLRPFVVTKEAYIDYCCDCIKADHKIIDVQMCRLRRELMAATGKKYIQGIWGRGHRFVNPE